MKKTGLLTLVIAAAFLLACLAWTMHLKELQSTMIVNRIANEAITTPKTSGSTQTELYFRWKKVTDIDLTKGLYAVDSSVLLTSAKKDAPELIFNAGLIAKIKPLGTIKDKDGRFTVRQQVLSSHSFDPITFCYPLDTQVLVYDLYNNNNALKVVKFEIKPDAVPAPYNLIKTGVVNSSEMDVAGKDIVIRSFAVVRRENLLGYINSSAMLWVALIVCVAASFSKNDSARIGGSVAALLLATSSNLVNVSKVCPDNMVNFAQLSTFYYFVVFALMLHAAVASFNNSAKITALNSQKAQSGNDNAAVITNALNKAKHFGELLKRAWIMTVVLFIAYYFLTYYILVT